MPEDPEIIALRIHQIAAMAGALAVAVAELDADGESLSHALYLIEENLLDVEARVERLRADAPPLPSEFLAHVEALRALFARADANKLQRALEQNDVPAACEALGVSESELERMLRSGQQFAETFTSIRARRATR